MTEPEAKTKDCCDPRWQYKTCSGSDCMGWRWERALNVEKVGDMTGYNQSDGEHGYCGKAGKPE